MTTNARPAPAWDEEAAVEGMARRLHADACSEHEYAWEPNAGTFRDQARELLAVVREHLPVKPDRETVARAIDALDVAHEGRVLAWSEDADPATERSAPQPLTNLDRADAVLDLWPGRSEAEVKREGAVEALRAYAADLNLHDAVQDGWGKYGDDLCGDDPDPCLFWDMTHAEQKRINARADRLAAEGGADRG